MAVPPTYADLGKCARDVFTKGYGECFGANGLGWHVWDFTHHSSGDLGGSTLRTLMSGGKKDKPTLPNKAVLVCTPGKGRLTNRCRQVDALVSSPTGGSSSVCAVVMECNF